MALSNWCEAPHRNFQILVLDFILAFVAAVSDPDGPDVVPVAERIAVIRQQPVDESPESKHLAKEIIK